MYHAGVASGGPGRRRMYIPRPRTCSVHPAGWGWPKPGTAPGSVSDNVAVDHAASSSRAAGPLVGHTWVAVTLSMVLALTALGPPSCPHARILSTTPPAGRHSGRPEAHHHPDDRHQTGRRAGHDSGGGDGGRPGHGGGADS